MKKKIRGLIAKYKDKIDSINSLYEDAIKKNNKSLALSCSASIIDYKEFIEYLERLL